MTTHSDSRGPRHAATEPGTTPQERSSPCRCGKPPTAFPGNADTRPSCLSCAAIDRHHIPESPPKLLPLPQHISQSPAARIHPMDTLWSHQALALDELAAGRNVVVSTPTASGKTLMFHLHALHLIDQEPGSAVLVLYPAKALANDQLLRWKAAFQSAGMPPDSVQQITGDVPVRRRLDLTRSSNILLMTPDVVHAWLIRNAHLPQVSALLRRLRLVITDEAHVYEDVLGTNSAFMFRRLDTASRAAGNPGPPQHLAATATIQSPAEHLESLTGHPFVSIGVSHNGAPRHPTTLLHIPPQDDEDTLESAAARMLTSILDNDPTAQVIVFHDSRQGAERVAAHARRPGQIAPYRAGYLPEERRQIEDKLRQNALRGIVSTSALEVGIDMPDLNYGINIGLPPTRKQLRQRLGRVGRSRPATFTILADKEIFQRHSESLRHYYENTVEPSRLHLDNEFIAYQHALCLEDESRRAPRAPGQSADNWPKSFQKAMTMAREENPPRALAHVRARSLRTPPQLAYSLRSAGEESLDLILSVDGRDQPSIGSINPPTALAETFPGALYRHNGQTYQAREWRRRHGKPYIRIVPAKAPPATSTKAVLRRAALVYPQSATNAAASTQPHAGAYAYLTMQVWTSVEGYVTRSGGHSATTYYADHPGDEALSRKSIAMPTSGLLLQISAPWMADNPEEPASNRPEIANLLAQELSYRHSVAPPNIGSLTDNILVATPDGNAYLLENALAVYDNIHGGLGLTLPLARDLRILLPALMGHPNANTTQLIHLLNNWIQTAHQSWTLPGDPGPTAWWRTFQPDTPVQFTDPHTGLLQRGQFTETRWEGQPIGRVRILSGEHYELPLTALAEQHPAANWTLWQPSTNRLRALSDG